MANLIEHVLPQVLDDGASRGTIRGELVERVVTDGPPPRRVLVTHELNPWSDDLLVLECIELLEGESRHRVRLEIARERQLELEAKVGVAARLLPDVDHGFVAVREVPDLTKCRRHLVLLREVVDGAALVQLSGQLLAHDK